MSARIASTGSAGDSASRTNRRVRTDGVRAALRVRAVRPRRRRAADAGTAPAGRAMVAVGAAGRSSPTAAGGVAVGIRIRDDGQAPLRDEPPQLAGPVEPDEDVAEQAVGAGRLAVRLQRIDGHVDRPSG